jgi:hypothetical protein
LILFTLRQGEDAVVATRCPRRPRIPLGYGALDALGISPEVQQELICRGGDTRPLFLRTRMGVGILDRTYAVETGTYLYVQLHCRPRHLMALINGGALGDPAENGFLVSREIREAEMRSRALREREYGILADAWEAVRARQRGILRPFDDGIVLRTHAEEAIRRLAAFAGCEVEGVTGVETDVASTESITRMLCHRPAVWEALLMTAFCEAYRYGGGTATVALSTVTGKDGDRLSVALTYAVKNGKLYGAERLERESLRELLRTVAHSGGMEISAETVDAAVRITVDCLYDPAVLESSDLKAPHGLSSEEESKKGVSRMGEVLSGEIK